MDVSASLTNQALEILDSVPCGLLRTDAKGLVLRVNLTFCNWVGQTAQSMIGLRKLQDMFTMGGRIFHQTHWAPLLQMQGSVSEVKFELIGHEGQILPVVLNAIRREVDGAVVHDVALFIAKDRDKYERELLLSRKRQEDMTAQATRLQDQERARAQFAEQMVGIVSHDLRNPLSTIQLSAALLLRGDLTANQQRILERLSRAGGRANRLITDLLDITQAQLGTGLFVAPKEIDLHAVVQDAVEELALAFPDSPLLHRSIGQGACKADPDRIAQLVGNLVANAINHGQAQSEVTITSEVDPQSCTISVHNFGPPIPEPLLNRLFSIMVRGENAAGGSQGIGLGLYIVKEIVKAHDGQVIATSKFGEGTTFKAVFQRA